MIAKNNTKSTTKLLLFFKYFWVIVILPKAVQFFALGMFLLIALNNEKIRICRTTIYFVFGLVIQLFAIVVKVVLSKPDASRIFAAVNTLGIWVIALLFFELYRIKVFSEFELKLLNQYIRFNLFVFICIYVFSLIYKENYVTVFGFKLWLKSYSYLDYGSQYRFVGFLESKLSSTHMFHFMIPLLYITLKGEKNTWKTVFLVLASFIATLSGYSRIGMITCSVLLFGYIFGILQKSFLTRKMVHLTMWLFFAVVIMLGLINYDGITQELYDLIYSRAGSTNARVALYKETLNTVMNDSPIIGMGIKEIMIGGFLPLGSHCTYLGILFKCGILGSAFFAFGFVSVIRKIWDTQKRKKDFIGLMVMFISYFGFIVFADIDGANWYIVGVMSLWGMLCNIHQLNDEDKTM